ncbi:16S rRNA pseudouridine(516) synthase, partial [Erwinia amylovora]|nr:16S rRNA pseudouridine(516) synthase [Erwinia amylovora]
MRLDQFNSRQLEVRRAIAARELRASQVTVAGEVVRDGASQLGADSSGAYEGEGLARE